MQYPFKPGPVKLSDAIAFVASVVYPRDPPREAKKRIRESIRYAVQGKSELTLLSPKTVKAEELFTWAVGKWPRLRSVSGLPLTPRIIGASWGVVSNATLKGFGMAIPSSMEELKQRYVECETRCWLRQRYPSNGHQTACNPHYPVAGQCV